MKDGILAERYLNALKNTLDESEVLAVLDELLEIVHSIVINKPFYSLLSSPLVSEEKKFKAISELVSKTTNPSRLLGFFKLLIQKKRVTTLSSLIVPVQQLISELSGRVNVRVEAAAAFNPSDAQVLAQYLSDVTQKTVKLEVEENPEMLGGFKAHLGDTIYDGSIQNSLSKFRQKFN